MQDWTKVVTEPLGLAGFALFLVFGVLSRVKRQKELPWLAPVASVMAILALAGGLTLAFLRSSRQSAAAAPPPPTGVQETQKNQVEQKTTGAGSPIVQGVQGDVTITVDQSTGAAKDTSAAMKTAKSQ